MFNRIQARPPATMVAKTASIVALQWRGFDEPTPPEGWAALRMLVPMPPSKRRNKSNKLM